MDQSEPQIVFFEDVRDLDSKTLLVDVREPKEIAESGCLPKSINIPLNQLNSDLVNLPADEFESKFKGFTKPSLEDPIIFSCRMGGRAHKAAMAMKQLGYQNAKYYKGSWSEWEQKMNK